MTRIRGFGALIVTVPLAIGLPLFAATPANAAGTMITTPVNGSVITSGSSVTVRATYDVSVLGMNLLVDPPGGGRRTIASTNLGLRGSLAGTVNISRNGRYTARLRGRSTWVYDTTTFSVRIPPAAPAGLSAKTSGDKLTVRWNRGAESDLTGYRVSVPGVGSRSGAVDGLCSGGGCSESFEVPPEKTGTVPITVRASRATGTGGTLSSRASATTVSFGNAPGAARSRGRTRVDGPAAEPRAGDVPVNPLTAGSPMTLPSTRPDGGPGFAYPTPEPMVAAPGLDGSPAASSDRLRWGRSVGTALVLLVIAAHLSTWTRRLRVAQSGLSVRGMAARTARGGTGRTRVQRARERIVRAEAAAQAAGATRSPRGPSSRGPRAVPRTDGDHDAGTPESRRATPASPLGSEPASAKVTAGEREVEVSGVHASRGGRVAQRWGGARVRGRHAMPAGTDRSARRPGRRRAT